MKRGKGHLLGRTEGKGHWLNGHLVHRSIRIGGSTMRGEKGHTYLKEKGALLGYSKKWGHFAPLERRLLIKKNTSQRQFESGCIS